jgi:hypothetical protein
MGSGLCTWTSALRSSKKFTLERLSQRLSQWRVSAMLEEAPCIARAHQSQAPNPSLL